MVLAQVILHSDHWNLLAMENQVMYNYRLKPGVFFPLEIESKSFFWKVALLCSFHVYMHIQYLVGFVALTTALQDLVAQTMLKIQCKSVFTSV